MESWKTYGDDLFSSMSLDGMIEQGSAFGRILKEEERVDDMNIFVDQACRDDKDCGLS